MPVAEGYVTAIEGPNEFDVNGRLIATTDATLYGTLKGKAVAGPGLWRSAVQVGAYVLVRGNDNGRHKPASAEIVRVRDERTVTLSGMAVIERVVARGAEPVFQADGYRIRIVPATEIYYTGTLKTLGAVEPNTWLRFEGKRDQDGVVVASRARFYTPDAMKIKKQRAPGEMRLSLQPPQFNPGKQQDPLSANSQSTPAEAMEDGSVSLGNLGRQHTIPADRALQERVQRIGMRLVPEYQKKLADDDPTKIQFEFYAVEDPKTRAEICTGDGLILIPVSALGRLQNDDELAAVLADGIAFNLQRQMVRVAVDKGILLASEAASLAVGRFVPVLGIASTAGVITTAKNMNEALEDERARLALALMADAGFDPRQAPQAWRLLAAKKLPKDLTRLNYPDFAAYQLNILKLQYDGQLGGAAQATRATADNH